MSIWINDTPEQAPASEHDADMPSQCTACQAREAEMTAEMER